MLLRYHIKNDFLTLVSSLLPSFYLPWPQAEERRKGNGFIILGRAKLYNGWCLKAWAACLEHDWSRSSLRRELICKRQGDTQQTWCLKLVATRNTADGSPSAADVLQTYPVPRFILSLIHRHSEKHQDLHPKTWCATSHPWKTITDMLFFLRTFFNRWLRKHPPSDCIPIRSDT